MTIATINLGTAPSGVGGDAARNAFEKVNTNFSQTENAASRIVGTDNDNQVLDKAGLQILIKDPRRQEVEALSGGRNTVIYDAQGNPNVMVVIPRFNYQDLGLPDLQLGTGTPTAFLTNGVPRGEILIAKYLASAGGSTCAVGGGVQPLTGVSYDQAKARCTGKGANWHLMSVHEWAAIALWSLANGTVPRGNTNYGRAHDRLFETARRSDNGVPGDSAGTGRTDTGKGPVTWTHDHTVHGIHDLVGNVWEWQDQMMLVEGQIKTTLDNNPAVLDSNFAAHAAYYDSTSTTGGVPRLNSQVINRLGAIGDSANAGNLASVDFKSLTKESAYSPSELLRRLLLETASSNTFQGRLYVRNFGNRFPFRGGGWQSSINAGLASLYLLSPRDTSDVSFSFRPAYFA
ncbi:SUMF1/EgtB/PvdO family nonheme iron enzyme [Shewanella sp. SM34]|uniref:SUMF1/EgtB/PvdO family nonheme iron enzyme n=1 Tax=unclassified Shewanella TaxID=196818 RepID=UPI0021D81ED8|nr:MULTISPECIES: SUMF1/EgtB/PvdO family nonheme iron enzyme [unclassified Shewanella]MCU8057798.1 SUMF1/EgtB/PvdO family nonheme iron enzyme [Shewanella sp. SM35]MCU8066628.1 SUMF1/EgtB/PvdO family nonheme iron enzyme [Shewanella sp. SM34]